MSRGFNFFNYMTYHMVRDYFKAKDQQKKAVAKFEEKNYKTASRAAEKWIKNVRKFAETSYGVHYSKELHYGATQALLAIAAEIRQSDQNWNDHREILIDYIINSGTGGVTFADFAAASERNGNIREKIPLAWVDYSACGDFWTCLGRCLKKHKTPHSKFTDLMSPLQDFMAGFAFCGPLQSNVESIDTRFLNRATDGVNRGMEAAQTQQTKPTGSGVDVWADGTSAEHIQRMKIIWEHLLNSSDGGREIADPQLLLSMLVGKTITDIIIYGSIPAKDKLLEVEMVFAENRLELGTTAKEFVLDMANHGENWKLINKMMMPHDGQPPMFWQIAQIMSIKGNCKDEFDNLIQEFMSFAYCFVSEIMKKYPNGGYDREKLLPYLKTLMPAEAPKN